MAHWAISAGTDGRDYSDKFFSSGMAFVGGRSNEERMEEVLPGDIIVLKRGTTSIRAVGEVVERDDVFRGWGDKEWLYHFDGWRLAAWCNVDWRVPDQPIVVQGFRQGTIYQLWVPQIIEQANACLQELDIHRGCGEPPPTQELTYENILSRLVSEGLRPNTADELTDTFRRLKLLADYYYNCSDWKKVGEDETRAFLVLPLLLSLGWAEQKLKLEYVVAAGKADVAGFTKPFHAKNSKCKLIVETKSFGQGLDYAPKQAERYARDIDSCDTLVVSNGHCYKAYKKRDGHFSPEPTAFLNLTRLRDRYPLDPENVGGAVDLLQCLMPTG